MEENTVINTTPPKMADSNDWRKFLELVTLSLGAGFLLCGIIFFFAYNWETIHRFIKMGIVAALLLSTYVVVAKVPMRDWVRNITIFAMCVLIGAFLAVFGQVYQTGADSYLLFLTWALCIVVWVAVADFYPLWLFFVCLVLLTCILALKCFEWETIVLTNIAALSFFTLFFEYSPRLIPQKSTAPKWFMTLLFSCLSILATTSFITSFFNDDPLLCFFAGVALCVWGLLYANIKKNIAIYTAFCLGVLVSAVVYLCKNAVWHCDSFLIISFLIGVSTMVAVYFLGKHIIHLKKKWENISPTQTETENQEYE